MLISIRRSNQPATSPTVAIFSGSFSLEGFSRNKHQLFGWIIFSLMASSSQATEEVINSINTSDCLPGFTLPKAASWLV